MEGTAGSPKLLTVEEKWQIIFNEVSAFESKICFTIKQPDTNVNGSE